MEKIGNVKEEIHEALIEAKMHIDEEKEKDKRRNNMIIYRMPESTAASVESRKKEDFDYCMLLFQDVLEVECGNDAIQYMFRVGKKDQTRVRPVMVMFRETRVKNEIMESLGKLAEADEKFRSPCRMM